MGAFCLSKLEIDIVCQQVQWQLKTTNSMKGKPDALHSVGNDLPWCMATSDLHSVFPVLFSCHSSGSLLSAGLTSSSSIFAGLKGVFPPDVVYTSPRYRRVTNFLGSRTNVIMACCLLQKWFIAVLHVLLMYDSPLQGIA